MAPASTTALWRVGGVGCEVTTGSPEMEASDKRETGREPAQNRQAEKEHEDAHKRRKILGDEEGEQEEPRRSKGGIQFVLSPPTPPSTLHGGLRINHLQARIRDINSVPPPSPGRWSASPERGNSISRSVSLSSPKPGVSVRTSRSPHSSRSPSFDVGNMESPKTGDRGSAGYEQSGDTPRHSRSPIASNSRRSSASATPPLASPHRVMEVPRNFTEEWRKSAEGRRTHVSTHSWGGDWTGYEEPKETRHKKNQSMVEDTNFTFMTPAQEGLRVFPATDSFNMRKTHTMLENANRAHASTKRIQEPRRHSRSHSVAVNTLYDLSEQEPSWENRNLSANAQLQMMVARKAKVEEWVAPPTPEQKAALDRRFLAIPQQSVPGRAQMLYGQGVLRSPERVAAETAKGMSRNGSDAPALREIAEKNAGSDGAKSLESSDDNSYSGGKFIRKGTALSPIVTERRKGSGTSPHLMSHSRARSYSGTTQNPVTSPLASPHRRRRTQDHLDLAIHSSNHDDYSSVTRQNSLDSEGTVPLPLSQCYQMPASSPSARSATTSTTYIASEMGDDNNDGATDPYLQFTDFEKTKNQRIRKRPQSNLDPIYSGVMGPAETDLYTPKKKVRAPRLKVKTAKAPISGFKLFRYRLQLYFLYIFYTGWFVADLVFTVYVQAVKMGYPLEIKWEPLQKAVEWYHPYEGSWLEVGTVVAPKVVAFTWIWMSLTLFFLTIFSFKDEPDLEIEQFMDEEDYPTVDVFLPRYKEPWDIFRPTVAAALGLNYPESKLNVYVCDDGNRCGVGVKEELKENFYLGTRRNLHYLARPDGTHAKSGNLNHGLKHSRGDLVVVFDADMVADPAFLRKLIPHLLEWDKEQSIYYFGDTAFIQVTQCFYNENDWMVRLFDGTNLMFYALTMPGMNGKNAAPMVGTGFILQRTAINEVGGFVTAYSVEDVTTTLALHQRGWRSKYKHCRLVEGLSPATLQEFFKQRLRWGTGSAQLLRYIAPLTLRGLTWAQRLGNFSSHNYWAVVLVMWIFLMARYVLWLVYLYLTPAPDGVTENRRLSLLPTQFLPILVALLGLPNVPFLSKIQTMMSMLAFLPVYIRIAWLLVCGKLHPTKPRHGKLKVAASSESYGNYLPADAYFNVIVTLVVTAACVVFSALPNLGIGPQVKGYLYYVQLGTLLAWVWFSNFPMIYEVLKIAFCLSEEEEEDEEEEEEQKPSAPSHPSKTKALDKGSEDEAKVVINIKDLQVPPEKKNQGILSDVNRRAAIVVASPEGQVAPPTPRAGADLERITISSEEQDEVPSLPIRSPARISREHLSQISSPGHTKNLAHADGKEEDEFIGFPATTVKEAVAAPRGRRHSRTKSMSMASSSSSPGHARMPSNVVFYSPHPDNTLAKGLASPDSLEEA